ARSAVRHLRRVRQSARLHHGGRHRRRRLRPAARRDAVAAHGDRRAAARGTAPTPGLHAPRRDQRDSARRDRAGTGDALMTTTGTAAETVDLTVDPDLQSLMTDLVSGFSAPDADPDPAAVWATLTEVGLARLTAPEES